MARSAEQKSAKKAARKAAS